jgi:hypothetical protein
VIKEERPQYVELTFQLAKDSGRLSFAIDSPASVQNAKSIIYDLLYRIEHGMKPILITEGVEYGNEPF